MTAAAFEWTDKFLLGYAPMDEVHHEFVTLVNALRTCADADMPAALNAFAEHAERHFSEELEWMKATDFPAMECHADEHAAVLKSVREVQAIVATGDCKHVRSLADALVDWFPGHADYLDSALSHWLVKKRHGGAPVVLRRGVKPAEAGDVEAFVPPQR
jgi:hemerythrin